MNAKETAIFRSLGWIRYKVDGIGNYELTEISGVLSMWLPLPGQIWNDTRLKAFTNWSLNLRNTWEMNPIGAYYSVQDVFGSAMFVITKKGHTSCIKLNDPTSELSHDNFQKKGNVYWKGVWNEIYHFFLPFAKWRDHYHRDGVLRYRIEHHLRARWSRRPAACEALRRSSWMSLSRVRRWHG